MRKYSSLPTHASVAAYLICCGVSSRFSQLEHWALLLMRKPMRLAARVRSPSFYQAVSCVKNQEKDVCTVGDSA